MPQIFKMRGWITVLCVVPAAWALTVVPKPLNQTVPGTLLSLDPRRFEFEATGKDSPLLQVTFLT